jgi:hypothetical protein
VSSVSSTVTEAEPPPERAPVRKRPLRFIIALGLVSLFADVVYEGAARGTKVRKSFKREAEAKSWRANALAAANRGALRPTPRDNELDEQVPDWARGGPARVRADRLTSVRAGDDREARGEGVGRGRARADHAPRMPPYVRLAAHRCRRQPEAIQTFMGHSKIQTTFDIYGHLMPGSRDEIRARMDAYLSAAEAPSAA